MIEICIIKVKLDSLEKHLICLQSCKPNIAADIKASEEIHLDLDNDVENRRDKKAASAPSESLLPEPHQVHISSLILIV